MADRSPSSIIREWQAKGVGDNDRNAISRMLAGMDQPAPAYADTPLGDPTQGKATPRYADSATNAKYLAQQNWRGIGEAALGGADWLNSFVIDPVIEPWQRGLGVEKPFTFGKPSEAAADLAASATNQPVIDPATIRPSVQQQAANSRAMYGMVPTDVSDVGTTAAASAAKLGILHGTPNLFLKMAEDDAALGKSADQIWHDWGWEKNPAQQWWTEDKGNPAMRTDVTRAAGQVQGQPVRQEFPPADQARFADNDDQLTMFEQIGAEQTPALHRATKTGDYDMPPGDLFSLHKRMPSRTDDVISNEQLFQNTPGLEFLGGVPMRMTDEPIDFGAKGLYHPPRMGEEKTRPYGGITVTTQGGGSELDTATHEMQHAVQNEFGFPGGYNSARAGADEAGQQVRNRITQDRETRRRLLDERTGAYWKHEDELFDKNPEPFTNPQFDEAGKLIQPEGALSLTDFNKRWGEQNPEKQRQIDELAELIPKGNQITNKVNPEIAYRTEAGEVAARNAAMRDAGVFTPEELRDLRPAKTEDVPREYQWFEGQGTGTVAPSAGPSAAKGDPDDPFWHPVSNIKLDQPRHEMTADYSPDTLPVAEKALDPQTMLGGVAIALPGDRTIAGRQLLGINGEPLENPIDLQGGPNFMRSAMQAGPDQAAWASNQGVITALANRIKKAGGSDQDVILAYMAMHPQGMDFSDMMTRAIRERMRGAEVRNQDLDEFDDRMKTWRGTQNKKTGVWEYPETPDFPGIQSLSDDWINTTAGVNRRKLAQLMDTKKYADRGFPRLGPIRSALLEPGLRDVPAGSTGFAFAKADPGGRVITNPELPHGSYDTQLGGEYIGGFGVPVPREIMFSTWGREQPAGANPSQLDYSFRRKNPIQQLDNQWLDTIMPYIEQARGR